MKYRVLDLLVDEEGQPYRLEDESIEISQDTPPLIEKVVCSAYCAFREASPSDVTSTDCRECFSKDVASGRLVAQSGKSYDIANGVPRLIPEDVLDEQTQSTFSMEWRYSSEGQRNWGEPLEDRERKFFLGTGLTADDAQGMLMVDAGCGSGFLDRHLAQRFGFEILAFDQSTSPFQIQHNKTEPLLYPVQASVVHPPLRPRSFDLVYCAGVLHHTHDTKEAFNAIVPLVREGGRLYVWLYHPYDRTHYPTGLNKARSYDWLRRNVTSRLNHRTQESIYNLLSFPFLLKQRLEYTLGRKEVLLTREEKMQALVDQLSPQYAWRHTEAEVRSWFEEWGFEEIESADHGPYGFGMRGVAPAAVEKG